VTSKSSARSVNKVGGFIVYTDHDVLAIDADCAQRLGDFYAFFDKETVSKPTQASPLKRMLGVLPEMKIEERRIYREFVKLASIQRIVCRRPA
jgi:hypothetical protein